MDVFRLVAFAILMQGNGGILTKHPDYILEKWQACQVRDEAELLSLLDPSNQAMFKAWKAKWLRKGGA